ncbi:AF4/FMR2 family member [Trichinella pseudospiralis]
MNRKIIISLLLSTLTITSFGERIFQLQGTVFCASSPATNLMVKIYDKQLAQSNLVAFAYCWSKESKSKASKLKLISKRSTKPAGS